VEDARDLGQDGIGDRKIEQPDAGCLEQFPRLAAEV